MEKNKNNITVRSFLGSLLVIFILMAATYALTFVIPSGEFARKTVDGNLVLDTDAGFSYVEGGLPFWKWLASPFLVLGADGSTTLIAVLIFLLVIGGIMNTLSECGFMQYMLGRMVARFGRTRYKLMAVMVLFFMLMGSFVGSFEEVVPLVPIVTSLAVSLGWDVVTGIGMSLLSVGCGFAAGVMNPFTVGVAQNLAGLPMFSGMPFRALSFVLIYALLIVCLRIHAKKVEKPLAEEGSAFTADEKMDKALRSFVIILGTGIAIVLASPFITFLQDLTMIIVAVMFLVAGTVSSLVAGLGRKFPKSFATGVFNILPAMLMILMASSIKYILVESKTLDTILYGAVNIAGTLPRFAIILFIYLLVLVMNFFVASGSAKAFMLIPLIIPIAQVFGISPQLCIVAYAFGDGFSNVFYPTNPALLISLGLVDMPYPKYAKWAWKFQLLNLALTSGILILGLAVGY